MKTYMENETTLKATSAKFVPSDKRYPDCECKLVLTEQYLYVLEDNFDGSFERHFQIPFRRLLAMEEYVGESALDRENSGYSEGRKHDAPSSREGIAIPESTAGLFGGWTAFFQARGQKGRKVRQKKFLQVKYDDGKQHPEILFFEDCADMAGMINAFRGYANHL